MKNLRVKKSKYFSIKVGKYALSEAEKDLFDAICIDYVDFTMWSDVIE